MVRRAGTGWLRAFFGLSACWIAAAVASCAGGDDIRRGGAGESCTRTDDCRSPLLCIQNVCGGPTATTTGAGGEGATASGGHATTTTDSAGAGGAGASGASGNGGGAGGSGATATGGAAAHSAGGSGATTAGGSSQGGAGGELPWCEGIGDSINACDDCLDYQCHDEACACGDECHALEGCIEALCRSLDGTDDESDCFVYCQGLHLAGKQQHQGVVWCSYYDSACADACYGGYPVIYPACRGAVQIGSCAAEWTACNDSVDCLLYRDCTASCQTLADCLDCSATAAGMAARALYEAWETCVAAECIGESWW